jgi:hypothetical protein
MHISTIFKFAFFTSAALPTVLCAPIITREHALTPEHRPNANLEAYGHDGHLAEHATHIAGESISTRAFVDIYLRTVDKNNIKFEDSAKLGLHGVDPKHHAAIIDYHKEVVKQDMEKHGAHSAQILHSEHYGGSNPNEALHITANYFDEHGNQIKSPYSVQKAQAGVKTEGSFHVYNDKQTHPVAAPQAWADKLVEHKADHDAKLPGLLKAQADQKAHDDKAKQDAADRVAKAQQANAKRVQNQEHGKDEKAAQRKAEKKAIQDAAEI